MQTKPPGVIQVTGPLDHTGLKQGSNEVGILRTQSAEPVVKPGFDTGAPDQQGRAIDANAGNHPPIISYKSKSVRQSLVISMNLRGNSGRNQASRHRRSSAQPRRDGRIAGRYRPAGMCFGSTSRSMRRHAESWHSRGKDAAQPGNDAGENRGSPGARRAAHAFLVHAADRAIQCGRNILRRIRCASRRKSTLRRFRRSTPN